MVTSGRTCLVLCIVLTVCCTPGLAKATRSRRDIGDDDPDNTDTGGCPTGTEELDSGGCGSCDAGLYLDSGTGKCTACPYDTYNDKKSATQCEPCPEDTHTPTIAAQDESWCMGVCIIPTSSKSFYERYSDQTLLEPADRVAAGEQIIFQCIDSHTIPDTRYSYVAITCTVSTASSLPHTCVNTDERSEENGLICYESCYKESFGGTTRFVKVVNGGAVTVETCPVAECQGGNDTCVTVSYTSDEGVAVSHYTCQVSSLFDSEICTASEAEGACSVARCDTQRCNAPDSAAARTRGTLLLVWVAVLVMGCHGDVLLW